MRVIAGKYRNRNLKANDRFRPTTDRVRETLFNILQNEMDGAVFVDAFAGSGAVGIEALSRGASIVYFLESNRKTLQILESNLTTCCEGERWRIYSLPVIKGLNVIQQTEQRVDFVFFDPPYEFGEYAELLERASVLFPDATYIVEASFRKRFDIPAELELFRVRNIGETCLSFFRRRTA